ncbi:DUF4369 domain-containing protein [Prevotella sp. P5-92]|uniref:DUF4369 domain-containing protein n=1 Tax=Prevotella sp. P5-92 TaxID=2024222 RepID=UPI001302F875|nr:DUF4369 domain-containing protein [Prevotella sp. P5-92]
MKKILFACVITLMTLALGGCKSEKRIVNGKCHIMGTINPKFNGKKIFLVPMTRPATIETVDSMVVADGKFEFTADTCDLRVIRVDYHFRIGVQDLLVVTEPGDLVVNIDSISSCKGTPQNDSLQAWKEHTERFNMECQPFMIDGRNAEKKGDITTAEAMKAKLDSLRRDYRRASNALGESMKGTSLGDFLLKQFPKTYKKKMPDGSIEEVPFF